MVATITQAAYLKYIYIYISSWTNELLRNTAVNVVCLATKIQHALTVELQAWPQCLSSRMYSENQLFNYIHKPSVFLAARKINVKNVKEVLCHQLTAIE